MSQGQRNPVQAPLFVAMEEVLRHMPRDPFYTRLQTAIDWAFIYPLTRGLYARTMGRPSLDPVVFVKALLYGFLEQVPSYVALELRLADSMTARRFLGYTLTEQTPDESTLRKTLALWPEAVFQQIFTHVLAACREAGLVRGRAVGVDSTTVPAQASLDRLQHRTLDCTYRAYLATLAQTDAPPPPTRANADWVCTTDPDARLARMKDGHIDLAYKASTAVDLETGAVLAVEVTTADVSDRQDLVAPLAQAVETLAALGLPPPVVGVADKGYHDGAMLAEVEEALGITPLVRAPHPGQPSAPGFAPTDFTVEAEADQLRCPAGQVLTRRPGEERERPGWRVYRAGPGCRACPHWGTCTRDGKGRKVRRADAEAVVAANRARGDTPEAATLFAARQTRGEAPFSFLKRRGGGQIRGRGLGVAGKETLLGFLAWNLVLLVRRRADLPLRGVRQRVEAAVRRWCRILGARARWAARRRLRRALPVRAHRATA